MRGRRKRGAYKFSFWYADGSAYHVESLRTFTDKEIAEAVRAYVMPVLERLERDGGDPVSGDESPDGGTLQPSSGRTR